MNRTEVAAFDRLQEWKECRDVGDAFIQDGVSRGSVRLLVKICEPCAVKKSCFDMVDPCRSYFSGVCAGVGWATGEPLVGDHYRSRSVHVRRAARIYAALKDEVE
jgi:hypothetical protein